MAKSGSEWEGLENTIEEPEELKVFYCALDSFVQYGRVAHFNFTHLRRQTFYALPQEEWKVLAAPPFNYLEILVQVDKAIDSNADLAKAIVRTGLQPFRTAHHLPIGPDVEPVLPKPWQNCAKHTDIDKARSTLRQFYRDWSAEGAAEREACYGPVLRAIDAERAARLAAHVNPDNPSPPPMKVLVPGAGLGRLVFELFVRGYQVEGNEISYHQLLASSYILNTCPRAGHHTVFPWVHSFSNHATRARHLQGYAVPDVHCASAFAAQTTPLSQPGTMSMCASDFICAYSSPVRRSSHDVVAAVFFLDTAPNLIRYLRTILHCLRPGGLLVNLGPLLWHFENAVPGRRGGDYDDEGPAVGDTTGIADPGSFELSDDEVMALVKTVGFEVVSHETGVEAPYIQDSESMLQTIYRASLWVARKPF